MAKNHPPRTKTMTLVLKFSVPWDDRESLEDTESLRKLQEDIREHFAQNVELVDTTCGRAFRMTMTPIVAIWQDEMLPKRERRYMSHEQLRRLEQEGYRLL